MATAYGIALDNRAALSRRDKGAGSILMVMVLRFYSNGLFHALHIIRIISI